MKNLFHKFMCLPFVDKVMNVWYEKGEWLHVIVFLYIVLIFLNLSVYL